MPDQIDEDMKVERAQVLRDLADASCTARVSERIVWGMEILLVVEEDGQLFGRAMCQAPTLTAWCISGSVSGEIVSVTIADTLLYEMEAE